MFCRCFAVDGVDIDLFGLNAAKGFEPRQEVAFGGVVKSFPFKFARQKDGLYLHLSVESAQRLNELLNIVRADRSIDDPDKFGIDGVEFENVVVHTHQSFPHSRAMAESGIAQHTHFGQRKIAVAQGEGVVDDGRKIGMQRRFTIAGKSDDVKRFSCAVHLSEGFGQSIGHLLPRRDGRLRASVGVETTFAVDAIESAEFPIGRKEIDAQRNPQPPTVNRSEDGSREENGGHDAIVGNR